MRVFARVFEEGRTIQSKEKASFSDREKTEKSEVISLLRLSSSLSNMIHISTRYILGRTTAAMRCCVLLSPSREECPALSPSPAHTPLTPHTRTPQNVAGWPAINKKTLCQRLASVRAISTTKFEQNMKTRSGRRSAWPEIRLIL